MASLCGNVLMGDDKTVFITEQDACGTVNTNPEFSQVQRISGFPMKTVSRVKSSTISATRQSKKNIKESVDYSWTLETEINSKTLDLFIAGAISSDMASNVEISSTTISVDSSDNSINDSASGLGDIIAGSWVKVNDVPYYIESVQDSGTVFISSAQTVTDIAEGEEVEIKGECFRSAKNDRLYTVQGRMPDDTVSGGVRYETYLDQLITSATLTIPTSGILTASFGFNGKSQLDSTLEVSGQTDEDIDEEDIQSLSAIDAVETIWIDFKKENAGVTECSLTYEPTITTQAQAGVEGPGVFGYGVCAPTMTLNTIALESNTFKEIAKYRDGDTFAVSMAIKMPNGDIIVITARECIYTENTQNDETGAIVISSGTISCEEDEYGTTIQIDVL